MKSTPFVCICIVLAIVAWPNNAMGTSTDHLRSLLANFETPVPSDDRAINRVPLDDRYPNRVASKLGHIFPTETKGSNEVNRMSSEMPLPWKLGSNIIPLIEDHPCSKLTCQHGGTCLQYGNNTAYCQCASFRKGYDCSISTMCMNQPCQNGGSCLDENAELGFRCVCKQQFIGSWCEIELDRKALNILSETMNVDTRKLGQKDKSKESTKTTKTDRQTTGVIIISSIAGTVLLILAVIGGYYLRQSIVKNHQLQQQSFPELTEMSGFCNDNREPTVPSSVQQHSLSVVMEEDEIPEIPEPASTPHVISPPVDHSDAVPGITNDAMDLQPNLVAGQSNSDILVILKTVSGAVQL